MPLLGKLLKQRIHFIFHRPWAACEGFADRRGNAIGEQSHWGGQDGNATSRWRCFSGVAHNCKKKTPVRFRTGVAFLLPIADGSEIRARQGCAHARSQPAPSHCEQRPEFSYPVAPHVGHSRQSSRSALLNVPPHRLPSESTMRPHFPVLALAISELAARHLVQ